MKRAAIAARVAAPSETPSPMKLELHWQGPYGAGLFPEDASDCAELLRASVYLRVKRYARAAALPMSANRNKCWHASISIWAPCST